MSAVRSLGVGRQAAGIGLLSLILTALLPLSCGTWSRLPYYEPGDHRSPPLTLMSDEEFEVRYETCERPYVVAIEAREGAGLLLFGAEHTRNPDDPQIQEIERRFVAFAPSVALCESRPGVLFPGLMDPVETFQEPGAVHDLARDAGIPTYTWEPPMETVVQALLESFAPEQIALFLVLRPYFSNLRHGRLDDPEGFVADTFDRARLPGLEGSLTDISDIDRIWQRDFAEYADWRDTSDQYGLPGYLSEIARASNTARDLHLARVILDLVSKRERVFAVAGSSHAVRLEPALLGALGR